MGHLAMVVHVLLILNTEIYHRTTPLRRGTSIPSTATYSTICSGNLAWASSPFIILIHRSRHNGLRVLERRQLPTQVVLK